MSGLQASVSVRRRNVDIQVEVPDGAVLAVLGPNGAGKSTLLSAVAGLVRPDDGYVRLDGRILTDTTKSVAVPPHRRSVGLLAQDALLFPHLNAVANVAFGARSAGTRRAEAHRQARQWLAAVDAADLAHSKPAQLSGGQAQRVAVARALAAEPALLLLDEPMAALDATAIPAMRTLLRSVLRERRRTAVLVTHDIVDAFSLADRVVVVEGGRVVERGAVRDVLARPRSGFAARLAGVNLLSGSVLDDGLVTGAAHVAGTVHDGCRRGEAAVAMFAPTAVAVHRLQPEGSPRNVFAVRVTQVEGRGGTVRVNADAGCADHAVLMADVTAASAAELEIVPGAEMFFAVKATEVSVYPV